MLNNFFMSFTTNLLIPPFQNKHKNSSYWKGFRFCLVESDWGVTSIWNREWMEFSGKVKACSSIESYLSHTEAGWRYCLSDIFSFDNRRTWGWKKNFHQILEIVNKSRWSSSEQIRNVKECCHFWNSSKKRTGIGKVCCERNTKCFLELGL